MVWITIRFLTGHHSSGPCATSEDVLFWSNIQQQKFYYSSLRTSLCCLFTSRLSFLTKDALRPMGAIVHSKCTKQNWLGMSTIDSWNNRLIRTSDLKICPSGFPAVKVWTLTWLNLTCYSSSWVSVRRGHAGAICLLSVRLLDGTHNFLKTGR